MVRIIPKAACDKCHLNYDKWLVSSINLRSTLVIFFYLNSAVNIDINLPGHASPAPVRRHPGAESAHVEIKQT